MVPAVVMRPSGRYVWHPLATVAAMVVAQHTHGGGEPNRWQLEQVAALAPTPAALPVAEALAVPAHWVDTGCDARGVWGRCIGGSSEPYECAVDHVAVRFRCGCASRRRPCKHALALLLLWSRHGVPAAAPGAGWRPHWLVGWMGDPPSDTPPASPTDRPVGADVADGADAGSADTSHAVHTADGLSTDSPPPGGPDRSARDRRVDGARAGLSDFDVWLHDRVRAGLADPAIASPSTWEAAAARLVDAKAGGLANRVRRLAALGAGDHGRLLEELSLLHLLAGAAARLHDLPPTLADGVATAVGWQVRQADVLAGVPRTDRWVVMGRSDTREDRIEVRRVWLRGAATGEWAMVLSFAAYQQVLDDSWSVGQQVHADVFRYPGPLGLRALVGRVHDTPVAQGVTQQAVSAPVPIGAVGLGEACDQIGSMIAAEPWIERVPACAIARPLRVDSRWVLADDSGALPLVADDGALDTLLACCADGARPITLEWTAAGVVPLAVFLDDRAVDIGPLADAGFVGGSTVHGVGR